MERVLKKTMELLKQATDEINKTQKRIFDLKA